MISYIYIGIIRIWEIQELDNRHKDLKTAPSLDFENSKVENVILPEIADCVIGDNIVITLTGEVQFHNGRIKDITVDLCGKNMVIIFFSMII